MSTPNNNIDPINGGPDDDLHNYIQQWIDMQNQYNSDFASLASLIQQMEALVKQGGQGTEEAFQIGQMAVMPGAMTLQGDAMGELSTSMNIGSACEEFSTQTQNEINNGSGITDAQAAQLLQYMKQLYDAVKYEMTLPKDQQWMDPNTANGILQSLTKVCSEFEQGSNPDTIASQNPNTWSIAHVVAEDINQWVTKPQTDDGGFDGGANTITGQAHMQNIQNAMQQWNNTQSAQSQSLQAQAQFAGNTFNQYMTSCSNLFNATSKQYQTFVQNQIAH